MDGTQNTILPDDLYTRPGMASPPVALDARDGDDLSAWDRVIVTGGDENVP
jgi:hypothetical protein